MKDTKNKGGAKSWGRELRSLPDLRNFWFPFLPPLPGMNSYFHSRAEAKILISRQLDDRMFSNALFTTSMKRPVRFHLWCFLGRVLFTSILPVGLCLNQVRPLLGYPLLGGSCVVRHLSKDFCKTDLVPMILQKYLWENFYICANNFISPLIN